MRTRVRHTLNLLRVGLNRLYGLSASPLYLSVLLKSRHLRLTMNGCCPRLENGGTRTLHTNEISTNFGRMPSYSAKTKRDGSRPTTPSCRSYCARCEARGRA